jgi:hypothetical protein
MFSTGASAASAKNLPAYDDCFGLLRSATSGGRLELTANLRCATTAEEERMRPDLVAGGQFPDLELPDHTGALVRLSKLAQGFPLIVSFYRGYW